MRSIILILLVLGMFSCQKENKIEPQVDTTFSVKMNGTNKTGVTGAYLDEDTDTLSIFGSVNPPQEEFIAIRIKFQGPGQYSLTKNQGRYYTTLGYDVQTSEYKFAPNSMGKLVITKYDPIEKVIEGNFEMALKKYYSYLTNDTDTLHLVDGSFKGKISNER